jgi:hypothetical protein
MVSKYSRVLSRSCQQLRAAWVAPQQAQSGSESCKTHEHISVYQIQNSPNIEGQGPVSRIYIPEKRVAQLYPQALGSLFLTSYDSLGYGVYIRTYLHTGEE